MNALLFQCYRDHQFLTRYQELFPLTTDDLAGLRKLDFKTASSTGDLVSSLITSGFIVEQGASHCFTLPILYPELTRRMAEYIRLDINPVVKATSKIIGGVMGDPALRGIDPHIVLGTITLGYLWQSLWSDMHHINSGGSAVLIEDPAKCHILYVDSVGVVGGGQLSWLNTSLQKNNRVLGNVFRSKDVTHSLGTIDEDRKIIPSGVAGDQLRLLKLVEQKRRKQDYISSLILKRPGITLQTIELLSKTLLKLTRLGQEVMANLDATSKRANLKFKTDFVSVNEADYQQAFYYVLSHVLINEWRHEGVLPSWRAVPYV